LGNNANTTYLYDPTMRRVQQITAKIPSQVIENVSFKYDAAGTMIEAKNDVPASSPQSRNKGGPYLYSFYRDPLYRLIKMNGSIYSSSVKYQTFEASFSYNNIGGLTSKIQNVMLTSSGVTSPSPLLTYNASYTYNSGRPGLPSEVVQRRPGSFQKFCYLYDENGNTITMITHNMADTHPDYMKTYWASLCEAYFAKNNTNTTFLVETMAFDDLQRLRSIHTNRTYQLYQYNYGRYRTVKSANDNGLTLYLDRTYQIKDGRSSKYYVIAGVPMAGKDSSMGASEVCNPNMPVQSPTCQYYYHSPYSSSNWVTTMIGAPIAHFTYLAKGEVDTSDIYEPNKCPALNGNLPIRPEGGEMDESGYVYTGDGYYNNALQLRL